jgi:hypothetical protein
MPDTLTLDTAEDLLEYLSSRDVLAYRYVRLLHRCATDGYKVGMMEDAVMAEAVSDWEAAACIPEQGCQEIHVGDITETREKLCRQSPVVVEHAYRKGQATYRLNSDLIDN